MVKSDKNFNDLEYIELKDIKYIKKSFFPLLLTGYSEQNLNSLIGFMIATPFIMVASLTALLIKVLTNTDYKVFNYITLFSIKGNRVLNIFFSSEEDY